MVSCADSFILAFRDFNYKALRSLYCKRIEQQEAWFRRLSLRATVRVEKMSK